MKYYKEYTIYKLLKEINPDKEPKLYKLINNRKYEYKIKLLHDTAANKIYYLNPETQEPQKYINFKKYGIKDKNEVTTIRADLKINSMNTKYVIFTIENTKNKYLITQKLKRL